MDPNDDVFDQNRELMYEELAGESERACAIVGVAYLDDLLGQVLEHYLLENAGAYRELLNPENPSAPLSSFGARLVASYGIGLISHSDLEALRKLKRIRNLFAHSLSTSFEDNEVKSHCHRLKDIVRALRFISEPPSARDVFQSVVAHYSGRFSEQLHLMKTFHVRGGFPSVIRLSAALSEALESKKSAG